MATAPEQRIGNLTTSKIAAAMVAEVESNLPLLLHANKSVQKPFETAGDGTVMEVIVPEMPTVGTGAWINEGDPVADHEGIEGDKGHELDYSNRAVPVVLHQKHVAFGLPSALEFASIEDMENLVTKPYGSTLASSIQSEVADAALNGSAFTTILTGSGDFPEVAKAVASLRKGRAYGKLYGVVGSTMNGVLAGQGINYFNPANNISDIFKSARLGEYQSAEWFTTPDVLDLVVPAGSAVAGDVGIEDTDIQTIAKGQRLFKDEGDEVWITTEGIVDSAKKMTNGWVKGEIFTIDGVNVADIFGNDLGELYSFKVLDTKLTASGDDKVISIKVKNPGYGDAAYAGGDATIDEVTKVTGPYVDPDTSEVSSQLYYRGIIYAQIALCVAFGRFAKPANANVAQYSGQNGISIRTTSAYQVLKDRTVTRWDCLVGANLSRPNWACEILMKAK